MHILVIAYEYPPIVAAQALRWHYLVGELALAGVRVDVVCPAMPGLPAYPGPRHLGIVEHRVWPGPFMGIAQYVFGKTRGRAAAAETAYTPSTGLAFRIYRAARRFLNLVLYPDLRTEWYPFARLKLAKLLRARRYDAVISSHEPGVDLLLGLWAKRRHRVRWLVDLADPLCAPYTPGWRRRLDLWLEGRVLRRADKVIVTTELLRGLLLERHAGLDTRKFACIPQGCAAQGRSGKTRRTDPERFTLTFTGNFYAGFRDPAALAEALRRLDWRDITCLFVGDNDAFLPFFAGIHGVRFLGRRDHFECLDLQAQADVLLNMGNTQAYQIPGKIYEYLGAGRPILHIAGGPDDPGARLIKESGAGLVVDNNPDAIAAGLTDLRDAWRNGRLDSIYPPRDDVIAAHTWAERARRLLNLLQDARDA